MYLLDTDTIIYILKGVPSVVESLNRHQEDPIKISAVTLMELYYGAYKSQRIPANLAKVKKIEQTIEVVDVSTESVEIFGMLKANLEKKGERLDDFGLIIASCALAHNLTLITNNTKHFKRIGGLKLLSWV